MKKEEVKLTSQHQITIPKRIREALNLRGGDRLEIKVLPGFKILLSPRKTIDPNDPAYRLGREILEAEDQIAKGEVIPWEQIKKEHDL